MQIETGGGDIAGWLTSAQPRLRRLAQLRGVAPDAIDDVAQETLMEAWRHRSRLHTPATPDGVYLWLDAICRNVCRRYAHTHLIEQRRRGERLTSYQQDEGALAAMETAELASTPDASAIDPLEALTRQELAQLLERALGALSADARQAMELCYLLELPQREVAARLGLSLSALEARLFRARQQVRQILGGSLRADAEALGLALDPQTADGWRETRLWCALCGRRHLLGVFLPQPTSGANLHMRCPDCERHYGLNDMDNSSVHSKGLIQLDGVQAFRPAWKRTMQGMARRLTQALDPARNACPYCGAPAQLALVDKRQPAMAPTGAPVETTLPPGLARHPYQFWVRWTCSHCQFAASDGMGVFAASDLVYWSHAQTRRFMTQHPRWRSEPELLVEYAGQPAIRFQMTDLASAARLTALANRQTLDVLAIF